jgi:hypothetical protein
MLLDGSPALVECYRKLSEENLPWTQVVAFQLAEWRRLAEEDPRSGRRLLLETLVRRVPMAEFPPCGVRRPTRRRSARTMSG